MNETREGEWERSHPHKWDRDTNGGRRRGSNRGHGRGVLGPLLLILLGVALLLDTLGIWSLDWADVWRLWPLLLVLAGLQIIFSRTAWGGLVSLLVVVVEESN